MGRLLNKKTTWLTEKMMSDYSVLIRNLNSSDNMNRLKACEVWFNKLVSDTWRNYRAWCTVDMGWVESYCLYQDSHSVVKKLTKEFDKWYNIQKEAILGNSDPMVIS